VTSLRQIASNQKNALKSTGPKTEDGKRRSSRNALRHGLTAETVVEPIEDADDYRAFQASLTAEYDAETVIERELVLRLASLLWRLRRAGAIETGLMRIEATQGPFSTDDFIADHINPAYPSPQAWMGDEMAGLESNGLRTDESQQPIVEIARCFLRLPIDSFALLGRYEASLWRQVRQTMNTLERKRHRVTARGWRSREPWHQET
jgi:hypothetical protein